MKIEQQDKGETIFLDELADDYESGVAVAGAAAKCAINRAKAAGKIDAETATWLFDQMLEVISEARQVSDSMTLS